MQTLHTSVHDFKKQINIHDIEMQKQIAAVVEYKLSVDELASWFAAAESDDDSSVSKPSAKKDIEKHLMDIKVVLYLITFFYLLNRCLRIICF